MRYFEFAYAQAKEEYKYPEVLKIPIYGGTLVFEHRLYKTDSHLRAEGLSYGPADRLRCNVSSALPAFSIAEISEKDYFQKLKNRTKKKKVKKDSMDGKSSNAKRSKDTRRDNDDSYSSRRYQDSAIN